MKTNGKILFFNPQDGTGVLITKEKRKIDFDIREWNDYDVMPSMGLDVSFDLNKDVATSITPFLEDTQQASQSTAKINMPQNDTPIVMQDEIENIMRLQSPKTITITMSLSGAIENYFGMVETNIKKREGYTKLNGRLSYILVRRFLWTTFNNFHEIDPKIITPKIYLLSQDLKLMSNLYDDFMKKIKYPKIAYQEIFLACQDNYVTIQTDNEKINEELGRRRNSETYLAAQLKAKKAEIQNAKNEEKIAELQNDYKILNGSYADTVHLIAELDNIYKQNFEILANFEDEFTNDFNLAFGTSAVNFNKSFIEILDAQSYFLDQLLWKEARLSPTIKRNLQKAGIKGDYTTKTYLKYYLDGHDDEKQTEEIKKLHELYTYLSSLNKNILLVFSSASEVIQYESYVKKENPEYNVKSFIDEKSALKWAKKHNVQALVVEESLASMHVDVFLKYYKKNVIDIPKIILIGNNKSSQDYVIQNLVPQGVSSNVLAKKLKELLLSD